MKSYHVVTAGIVAAVTLIVALVACNNRTTTATSSSTVMGDSTRIMNDRRTATVLLDSSRACYRDSVFYSLTTIDDTVHEHELHVIHDHASQTVYLHDTVYVKQDTTHLAAITTHSDSIRTVPATTNASGSPKNTFWWKAAKALKIFSAFAFAVLVIMMSIYNRLIRKRS